MPRIPVRIEPYTSPSRQHRHFKNKRDQVLRALGKAAYINGSHFAIMWVSARGDVETYASEALQDRLDGWFVKSGISDEAKKLVIGAQGNPRANPFNRDGDQQDDNDEDDLSEDERGLLLQVPGANSQASSSLNTPILPGDDVFSDNHHLSSLQHSSSSQLDSRPKLHRSASTSANGMKGRKNIMPLNINMANEQYYKVRGELQVQSAIDGHYMESLHGLGLDTDGGVMDTIIPPHSAPLRMPLASAKSSGRPANSTQQHVPQFETRLNNLTARTAFLELRFSQLQQGMCKTVAKAWIKIIEPKKQTRCPYNKGEEGKPAWWPEGVRHKEPDHLMKPERHALLLTILRSPKIQVARLQLATAEVVALIKADKVSLLMDVYRIAREEEKMREAGIDLDTPMTVGISTMDGWSEADQAVTNDRMGSPVEEEQEAGSNKKKTAGMSRSVSASSALKSNKRKYGAGDISSPLMERRGDMLDVPDASQRGGGSWMMQEATQGNMKKAMTSSPLVGMSNATYQQQQSGMEQHYGLITPLTGNSQLMDPSFLQAAKEGNDSLVAGYMSAPQPSHAQLFPHSGFPYQGAHQQQQQQQHHYNAHAPRDASNLFAYQQQRADNTNEGNQNGQGALGLQGMNMHWNNTGFNQDFSNDSNNNNAWWHHHHHQQQQQQQSSSQQSQQTHLQHQNQQPQKDSATSGNADASFDISFASTVDSAGPATPPLGTTPIHRSNSLKQQQHQPSSELGKPHDFIQQQHQHFNETQIHPGQLNRNQYNLSLGKVSNTYDSWTYQA